MDLKLMRLAKYEFQAVCVVNIVLLRRNAWAPRRGGTLLATDVEGKMQFKGRGHSLQALSLVITFMFRVIGVLGLKGTPGL